MDLVNALNALNLGECAECFLSVEGMVYFGKEMSEGKLCRKPMEWNVRDAVSFIPHITVFEYVWIPSRNCFGPGMSWSILDLLSIHLWGLQGGYFITIWGWDWTDYPPQPMLGTRFEKQDGRWVGEPFIGLVHGKKMEKWQDHSGPPHGSDMIWPVKNH